MFALHVISEGAHARTTSCFDQAVEADPGASMSWAWLAALYRIEYLHGINVRPLSQAFLASTATLAGQPARSR